LAEAMTRIAIVGSGATAQAARCAR
jgi:hypothetical protein